MKIKAIITGATGMVGKGVLLECLKSDQVASVLIINRRPINMQHPKLKEIIHKDFFNLDPIKDQLKGYNACYFCLGISSFRMSEEDYTRITYDLTMNFAKAVLESNKNLTFCYVSGEGTDSTEQGRSMWGRVKGKTENDILAMGFKDAYAFRPAYIQPIGDIKSSTPVYNLFIPVFKRLYPLLKAIFPKYTTTTEAIGLAMINVATGGYDKKHIASLDINALAGK